MRLVLAVVLLFVLTTFVHASDNLCKRADDPSFSPRQREFIGAAKEYLEQRDKRKLDACFEVRDGQNGHVFVSVLYIVGYRDGQPQFVVGGNVGVELDKRKTVVRLMPGA